MSVVSSCTREEHAHENVEQSRVRRQEVEGLRGRGEERQQHHATGDVLERRAMIANQTVRREDARADERSEQEDSKDERDERRRYQPNVDAGAPSRRPPSSATVRNRQGRTNDSRSGVIAVSSGAAAG